MVSGSKFRLGVWCRSLLGWVYVLNVLSGCGYIRIAKDREECLIKKKKVDSLAYQCSLNQG